MLTRYALAVLWVAAHFAAAADRNALPFDASAYPADAFRISRREFPFGQIRVRVIEIQRVDGAADGVPAYCRAWLEVRRSGRVIRQFYFSDIAPVGGSYGLFLPRQQPVAGQFLAVKEGDYDGRLILINPEGWATELPGGPFFVTNDGRYLVGLHSRDASALMVVDIAKHKVVLDGDDAAVPEVHSWYLDDTGYYFTAVDPADNEREMKDAVYRLDLVQFRVVKMPPVNSAGARRVVHTFDSQGMADCSVTPARGTGSARGLGGNGVETGQHVR